MQSRSFDWVYFKHIMCSICGNLSSILLFQGHFILKSLSFSCMLSKDRNRHTPSFVGNSRGFGAENRKGDILVYHSTQEIIFTMSKTSYKEESENNLFHLIVCLICISFFSFVADAGHG